MMSLAEAVRLELEGQALAEHVQTRSSTQSLFRMKTTHLSFFSFAMKRRNNLYRNKSENQKAASNSC